MNLKLSQITPEFVELSKKDKLSPNFSMFEMAASWREGRTEAVNLLYAHYYRASLEKLCVELLEPLRDHFQRPIHVNSGMRWAQPLPAGTGEATNDWEGIDVDIRSIYAKKKYAPRSQHSRGEAVDITMAGITTKAMWEWARTSSPNPFGQAIFEVGDRSTWLHLSIPGMRPDSGNLIYGEVLDAKIDAMHRARYTKFETLQGRKDRWGKQKIEMALSSTRNYRNDLTKTNA